MVIDGKNSFLLPSPYKNTPSTQEKKIDNKTRVESFFDIALSKAGYGKFHVLVFLLVGTAYSFTAMETMVIALIIPSAKCDLQMTSEDAGLLTAIPLIGNILGSFFWGCLADINGRKVILAITLLIGGLSSMLSSLSQNLGVFLLFRVMNSFGLGGVISASLPYLADFQSQKTKEKVVSWLEFWWTIGVIISPCLAWSLIPTNVSYKSEFFNYNSWNLFVTISGLLMTSLGFITMAYPESARFLEDIGEREKALNVLKQVYRLNTGKDDSHFMDDLKKEKGISTISNNSSDQKIPKRTLTIVLQDMGKQTKILFKKPFFLRTTMISFLSLVVTGVYFTLTMWFPELFSRFSHFEAKYPNETTSVCEVSSTFVGEDSCDVYIDPQIFKNTVIIGLSCLPTSIWVTLIISRLGSKLVLVVCTIFTGLTCLAMYFVTSSFQNLVLSCIFEEFASLSVMTIFCYLVDIFPSHVSGMATGICLAAGKIGALLGNFLFGYLIDYNCSVPTFAFSALAIVSGVLALFLPMRSNKTNPVVGD